MVATSASILSPKFKVRNAAHVSFQPTSPSPFYSSLKQLNKLTSKDGQSPRTTKELESMLDTTLDGQIFHPLTNMQPSHPDVVTHAYAEYVRLCSVNALPV